MERTHDMYSNDSTLRAARDGKATTVNVAIITTTEKCMIKV